MHQNIELHRKQVIYFSFFPFFAPFSFYLILLSPSAQQRWTAQQNRPSVEGPEGPPPTAMVSFALLCTFYVPKMCTAGQRVSLTITGPETSLLLFVLLLFFLFLSLSLFLFFFFLFFILAMKNCKTKTSGNLTNLPSVCLSVRQSIPMSHLPPAAGLCRLWSPF